VRSIRPDNASALDSEVEHRKMTEKYLLQVLPVDDRSSPEGHGAELRFNVSAATRPRSWAAPAPGSAHPCCAQRSPSPGTATAPARPGPTTARNSRQTRRGKSPEETPGTEPQAERKEQKNLNLCRQS